MFVLYLIFVFVFLLLVDRWKSTEFLNLHRQLGNDMMHIPVIGNAFAFLGNNEYTMTVLINTTLQSLKRKHKAMSFWLGNIFFVGISDADQAVVILKSTTDKKFIYKIMSYLFGNGSLFAPVNIWHRRRKTLVPTFTPRNINKFVPVFEANAKVVAERLKPKVGKGNVSLWDYISRYSLDSICETAFNVNVDIQRQPDHPFCNAFGDSLKNIAFRLSQPLLHIDAIYKFLPVYARLEDSKKIIYDFIDSLITKKKQLIRENKIEEEVKNYADDKAKVKSFLELMIDNCKGENKAYTDVELREEILVLALAGTDTSAVGMCFTLLLLSQHLDVQERVYNEIQEVLRNENEPLHSENLSKFKYLRAVIKESLRLYPPVPFLLRCNNQDIKLPSGIILPKDCNIIISVWGVHRNPEHWGEDANDFNPDRFMSDQTPNAFIPFSHGPRNCVGYQYAMLSMTTALVTLLRQYRFTPATNFTYNKITPLRLSYDIMIKHVDGFTVQIEDRNKINTEHIDDGAN